jgi:hypothetical protein
VPAVAETPPAEPEPAEPEPAEPPPSQPEPAGPDPAEPQPAAGFSLARLAWTASMAVAVLLAIASLALTIYAIAGGGF